MESPTVDHLLLSLNKDCPVGGVSLPFYQNPCPRDTFPSDAAPGSSELTKDLRTSQDVHSMCLKTCANNQNTLLTCSKQVCGFPFHWTSTPSSFPQLRAWTTTPNMSSSLSVLPTAPPGTRPHRPLIGVPAVALLTGARTGAPSLW